MSRSPIARQGTSGGGEAGASGRKTLPPRPEGASLGAPRESTSARDEAPHWSARPARAEDFDAWDELFAGYCDFYQRPSTPEHRRRVWSWIEAGTIHCLLAVPAVGSGERAARPTATAPPDQSEPDQAGAASARSDQSGLDQAPQAAAASDRAAAAAALAAAGERAVGLAHLRAMPSPLRGAETGFLDDLFIAPAARGSGAFECLMTAVRDLAVAQGWPQVRWITAAGNARARSAYDRVATKTDWVTYQLDP